jgi:hypothetical protein
MHDAEHLLALQGAFDVAALGDGDAVAGINQLAAMAVALANLALPRSGIVTPEGRRLEVGCNLLATGARVTGSILDEVIAPISRCQNTLIAQVTRLLKHDQDEGVRGVNRRWKLDGKTRPNAGETALLDLMTGDPDEEPLFTNRRDQWLKVVTEGPSDHFDDLRRCPRAFIAAATPKLLQDQLGGAHDGQAVVALSLNRIADAKKFGALCPAIMDGLIPCGPSGETVKGRLLVIDTGEMLREVATAPDDKNAWLGRLLWLVDGNSGPKPPTPPAGNANIVRLPNLYTRFEKAVRFLFVDRLNGSQAQPVTFECDITGSQVRWMGFLAEMEKLLPGISSTARRLLSSLMFGLRRLVAADKAPPGFKFSLSGIEALARFVVHRMANYRAALLFSADDARKLRHKRRILAKLEGASLDSRSIYHPLHLTADLCEELLTDLEASNLVRRSGRVWERVGGRGLPLDPDDCLQLVV